MTKRLELEPAEVDYLTAVLVERPWKEANNLIQKIVQQMNNQQLQDEVGVLRKRVEELTGPTKVSPPL
jgi:hypothetical protein